jgi:hypothetical protein
LHDIVFTLSKKGINKETTYTPIAEPSKENKPFDVAEYFALLGLDDYPKMLGTDHVPILQLDEKQMTDFMNGTFPWSTGLREDGTPMRKRVILGGSTVTLRNEQTNLVNEDEEVVEEVDELDENLLDDAPKAGGFF